MPRITEERFKIRFKPGEDIEHAEFCIHLLSINEAIYRHKNRLCVLTRQPHPKLGMSRPTYAIKYLTREHMKVIINNNFEFIEKENDRACLSVPKGILEAIFTLEHSEYTLVINYISKTPIIRPDGTMIVSGYDKSSLSFVSTMEWTDHVAEMPANLAAMAIKTIRLHFSRVTFASDLDFSVFVSALMTAFLCRELRTKPAFGISAEKPGSGKSTLVSAITALALGRAVTLINKAKTEQAFEKQLDAALRLRPGIISVDNVTYPIEGARLCSILSEREILIPATGNRTTTEVEPAMLFFNGNNLNIVGPDLKRRSLIIRLHERRETVDEARGSTWIDELLERRDVIVPEMMNLLVAFKRANSPRQTAPLASFEDWSRVVRDAIVWAGLPDPVLSQTRADPCSMPSARSDGLQLLLKITAGQRFTASSLLHNMKFSGLTDDDIGQLLQINSCGLSTVKIGIALRKLSARKTADLSLHCVGSHAGTSHWQIVPHP